ncbi:M3 family metallopeptidase [Pseudomonas sp.]|uniref:M3 family metallopeptidase n=1 Tax=Pseudomonas sp. TaxID=306 RepID=UPI002624394B|nr:M3 family metallopeptidase [Pseudomonas sp.]
MTTNNPLLLPYKLPPFSAIRAEHLVPAIQAIIEDNQIAIPSIISSQTPFPTWDDLVLAMDELNARLEDTLGVIELLGSTQSEPHWQAAIARCQALAERYHSGSTHTHALYTLYRRLAGSPIAALFDAQRQTTLRKVLREFHLAGIDLSLEQQLQLKALNLQLDGWQREYLERVENADKAWSKPIEDRALLSGLRDDTVESMREAAQARGLPGWLLTLSEETYREVVTYADNRSLRQDIMTAYYSRASDNEPVLAALLDVRQQKARLLGYPNYAQLALVGQMADTTEQVVTFLHQQVEQSRSAFAQDAEQLAQYAAQRGITEVQAWDADYFAEKIRQDTAGISQTALREYFPWEAVLQRLRTLAKTLFGVELVEQPTADTWHTDVRTFELREYAQPIGHLFIDPYRREGKSGPGSTVGLRNRRITAEGRPHMPIAVLNMALPAPTRTQPCLLDHLQLRILLHEFGHCLQHLLTAAPYRIISGVGEMGHDTGEFVSQVFEQFCFEPSFLIWLSGHFNTGQALPDAFAERIARYIHTQSSWETANVLLMALVDFELHRTYGDGRTPIKVFTAANAKVGLLQWPKGARPIHRFEQLAGDYGASAYSYKWSGVLATQAFARFKRDGLFNRATAKAFREAFITGGDERSLTSSLAIFLADQPTTPA